ncbi:MAG: hypothetical protein AUK44_00735 [Porphyromonadaceae bacterium CG2_30_38_12]|nr:MAG: hypothetical protein AUK44_00735 [Porphyromonadaceae bacterium CG2_30_38_12]
MNFIENIQKPIRNEMQQFSASFTETLSTDNELLVAINSYVINRKGKQLRPTLVLLTAALCGKINQKTIDGALAIELLHTASLIHDDIVDETSERRGMPSVNAQWSNKVAVFAGDYMFSKSLFCATKTNDLRILEVISNIGKHLTDGELQQLNNALDSRISETKYLHVIQNKTAELFAACAQVGGFSVGASAEQLGLIRNFGIYLGVCFQIKDDIFDYSENPSLGKPTGNDLRDGKITLPLIYALKNSTDDKRVVIAEIIERKDFTSGNIQTILEFARENGGINYAAEVMESYKLRAIEQLNSFEPSEAKTALIHCAEYAALRNF